MSQQLLGLHALIQEANLKFKVYEMGRYVREVSIDEWNEFEHGNFIWPYPVQRQAFFAVVGINDKLEESIVWTLRLPLDERGFLNLGARDQLVHTLIERASENAKALAEGRTKELKSAAEDIAQAFEPSLDKKAKLNSLIRRDNNAPSVEGFSLANRWLHSTEVNWQELSLQALSDLLVRHRDNGIAKALAAKVPSLDGALVDTIGQLLEGEDLQPILVTALLNRLKEQLAGDYPPQTSAALLRALCSSNSAKEACALVLNSAHGISADCISVIAGRCWMVLQAPELTQQFLENLAKLDDGNSFVPVMHQLLYIDSLRPFILGQLHQQHLHSPELQSAITRLLGQ